MVSPGDQATPRNALPLLYWLGLRWTGSRFAAGLGVTLYGLSRVLMFPCVVARPDMLCGCLGIAALAMAERVPEAVGAEFVEERGDRSDPFACHTRIYRAPTPGPDAARSPSTVPQ